jgi:hypothetical protein
MTVAELRTKDAASGVMSIISARGDNSGGLLTGPSPASMATLAPSTPAINTAAVVTGAALPAGQAYYLESVMLSYDAVPTGGVLTIVSNATTIVRAFVVAAGTQVLSLKTRLAAGADFTATLSAGGAAVTGSLSVNRTIVAL